MYVARVPEGYVEREVEVCTFNEKRVGTYVPNKPDRIRTRSRQISEVKKRQFHLQSTTEGVLVKKQMNNNNNNHINLHC